MHLVGNLEWRIDEGSRLNLEVENIDQDLRGHRLRGVPVDADGSFLTDIAWTATESTEFARLDARVLQARWDQNFGAFDTVYATSSLFAARAGNFPGQPRTFSALFTIGGFR